MALEINQCIISGRLGQDAELKELKNDTKLLTFSIANSRTYKDEEQTSWINCNLWGKSAEALAPYLTKGKLVVVTGRLVIDEYEKDGEKRKATKIDCVNVQFAEPKPADQATPAKGKPASKKVKVEDDFDDFDPDDAPF